MDWLFVPLGNFIQWTFQFIELAGMNFNYLIILIGMGLTVYWVMQMLKAKDDKGFFKK
jgi:hypothetical protein